MENWKNKKVVWFKWKEFQGFIPHETYTVIEETKEECLIKAGWFKKWTFKYSDDVNLSAAQQCGYCKLIN